jgi:hypothetical protein
VRYITQVHLEGGSRHEHITDLRWKAEVGTGTLTRGEMVQWVRNGGDARVEARPADVRVVVVEATPPYLRTVANGVYTDNLLSLPRF